MTRPTRHLAAQLKRLVEKPAGSGDGPERHNQARVNQEQLAVQNEELRQAQATLEEARDRFVELYDFAPNGYLTLDGNGVIRQINLTGAALFGKAKAAIEGMPVLGLVRGPDRGRMLEYLRRCRRLKAGSVVEGEFTFRMADHRRTVQLITRPHGEDESARREYFTTMIDISEERRLEQ
jgi:PAS domain S-box-containing protein